MMGRAILVSLIVLVAIAAAIAWPAEIYGGRFWDAVFRYQILIAGTFAVVAAGLGAIALVLATRAMIRENRNAELRQRKARARGIANLVGGELIRRAIEADLLREMCLEAQAKEPPSAISFAFGSIFRREPVLGLNDELVHVAEFAPWAALKALEDLSFFRIMITSVEAHTKDGICSIEADDLAFWEKRSGAIGKDLEKIGRLLNRLPQLAD